MNIAVRDELTNYLANVLSTVSDKKIKLPTVVNSSLSETFDDFVLAGWTPDVNSSAAIVPDYSTGSSHPSFVDQVLEMWFYYES